MIALKHCTWDSSECNRQTKEIKGIKTGKEVKLPLYADGKTVYVYGSFSIVGNFAPHPPGANVAMPGDNFVCHYWGRGCYWHLESRDAAKYSIGLEKSLSM